MANYFPFNNRPSAIYHYDSADGQQTVGSGKYWRVKVATPTGYYFTVNGENVQNRNANKVDQRTANTTGAASLYTVTSDMIFEGVISATATSGTAAASLDSSPASALGASIVIAGTSYDPHAATTIRLSAGESVYRYMSTAATANGVAISGFEFVDGARYGEFWLEDGDTCRMWNSTGFDSAGGGRMHVEEYDIP